MPARRTMTDANDRLVVIGGGIAGLASAWFASTLSDLKVLVVEREPRHDEHSSGRSAEIQRIAVPDAITRRLALATDAIYADPAASGLPADLAPIHRVGLVVGHPDPAPAWRDDLDGRVEMAAMDAEEVGRRAPHVRLAAPHATWFPTAGQVNAPRLLSTLARSCAARGVTFLRSAGDARIDVEGDRVVGVTPGRGEAIAATHVIDAAGAWAREVGAAAGAPVPLRPTRRHMLALARDPGAASPPVVWDDAAELYVRARGDRWLVSPCDLSDAEPRARGGYGVDPGVIERTRERLAAFAPDLAEAPLVDAWTGYRDLTPDDRPILGPDPRVAGLSWCASFGGHGMTLGLAAGRTAARAALGIEDPLAADCDPMRLLA